VATLCEGSPEVAVRLHFDEVSQVMRGTPEQRRLSRSQPEQPGLWTNLKTRAFWCV